MKVKELMTLNVAAVGQTASLKQVAELMVERGISGVPVFTGVLFGRSPAVHQFRPQRFGLAAKASAIFTAIPYVSA